MLVYPRVQVAGIFVYTFIFYRRSSRRFFYKRTGVFYLAGMSGGNGDNFKKFAETKFTSGCFRIFSRGVFLGGIKNGFNGKE